MFNEMFRLGCPPKFKTPEEMQVGIVAYFNNPPTRAMKTDIGMIDVPTLTITGLALHLGFASRQSFYDYEKNDNFSYTIKRARGYIENEYEMQLQNNNVTGAIFALKNLGWKDNKNIAIAAVEIPTDATPEEAARKYAEIMGS